MVAAARDIRETFARMAMNDEETVALIAGGHTFGKCHGAAEPGPHVGPEPEGAGVENQGLGWINSFGGGRADDTITSGLEGAWSTDPTRWDNNYFENLFGYEWELIKGPGGAHQWAPQGGAAADAVRDAHDPSKRHAPMMLTTDLALRVDPNYTPIARRFHADPAAFADAFARAWFKLTHRDMGSVERYLGPPVPAESLIWQDPVPPVDHDLIGDDDIAALKGRLLPSGLSVSRLVATAWASASTHRDSDKRGSANGARIRLAPQKDWAVNEPTELATALRAIEAIQSAFHGARTDGKRVSMADLIVLGGCAAIERAAKSAGYDVRVPFTPGRTDATQVQTDIHAFAALEPFADGCRNYIRDDYPGAPADLLLDRANLLTLTAPEMTVLLGGLRALNANVGGAPRGVFTDRPGVLTHDVLVNLLDMVVVWRRSGADAAVLEGRDRETGDLRWTGSVVDLVFGSNAQLRAIAEVYAAEDAREVFVRDFVAAWAKVMNLGRFDLA